MRPKFEHGKVPGSQGRFPLRGGRTATPQPDARQLTGAAGKDHSAAEPYLPESSGHGHPQHAPLGGSVRADADAARRGDGNTSGTGASVHPGNPLHGVDSSTNGNKA